MGQVKIKDPGDDLDYVFDYSDWLATSETISNYTITVDTGLTYASSDDSESSGLITCWLSGGTAGQDYNVVCSAITNAARTKEWTGIIRVKDR